ncbi:MAG: SPOR domain-containing protein [Prevotella sp.]
MKLYLSIIIALTLGSTTAHGQSFMDNLRSDQNGQGKITVNQSAEIDRLVNSVAKPVTEKTTAAGNKQATATTTHTEGNTKPATRHETRTERNGREESKNLTAGNATRTTPENTTEHTTEHSTTATPPLPATPNESETATVNTNKKIMRHSYKANGYRIQVYSGGNKRTDREKCEQIAARLKSRFPDLPIYVHFYSPSWKCRAGNYTSLEEAQNMLRQIKALGYNQACLVKGKINVQY